MKKMIGILICLLTVMFCAFAWADVAIDAAHFPDEAFRKYVEYFDSNRNGSLSESEIRKVTCIDVSESWISDLKGVEYFTALTELICWDNRLTSLDLSGNPWLTDLDCQYNQLTSLDVTGNPLLTGLYCNSNRLASLDVSRNPELTMLWCSDNELTSLDLSGNAKLNGLHCANNHLSALDLSGNPALTGLFCNGNHLTSLNASGCRELYSLECGSNGLTALDVSGNAMLTALDCSGNHLTSLDVSGTVLTRLDCSGNPLEQLDISSCGPLNQLVKETTPGIDENGTYGWRKTYEWGVTYEWLYMDQTLSLITDGDGYSPALGMTMADFIERYNAVGAPSCAPYQVLNEPQKWTVFNEYQVAWFYPDGNSSVILLLRTRDGSPSPSTSMGLDMIDICTSNPDDFASLISVAARCADVFSSNRSGAYTAADVILHFYENNLKQSGLSARCPLDADEKAYLSLIYYSSTREYYFQILPSSDARN